MLLAFMVLANNVSVEGKVVKNQEQYRAIKIM